MRTLTASALAVLLAASAWAAPPPPDGKPPYDTVEAISKGDNFRHWDNVKIDGEAYFVSPTLEYPVGMELNHFVLAIIEDTDHSSSATKAWTSEEVMKWLFQQRRDKNPKPGPDPFPAGNYGKQTSARPGLFPNRGPGFTCSAQSRILMEGPVPPACLPGELP